MKTEKDLFPNAENKLEINNVVKNLERVIPQEFFEDPCNKFLYDTAISELSSEELTLEKEKYINNYLDLLTNPSQGSVEERKNKYESLVDQEATDLLFSKLDDILKDERGIIGIPPGEEKPFDVKVLRLKSEYYFEQEEEWQELTGAPSLVMTRDLSIDNEPENSTIYLSHVDSEKILKDDEYAKLKISEFLHEYRHTQRSFAFANNQLYRFLDEICTNVTGCIDLTATLDILCSSTGDLKLKDFRKAYESGDKNLKVECLRKFKENFGGLGLMMLGGKRSSEHVGDSDGMKEQPYTKNYENENISFLETLLMALEENTQGKWLENLSKNIKDLSRKELEITREYSIASFCKGVQDTDAELTKKISTVLDQEIEEREKKEEIGL